VRTPGFHPFAGGVVRAEVATEVVSPAYDALTVEQRAEVRARQPRNYLGAILDPRDLPDGDHLAASRSAVAALVASGAFEERPPAYYVCRLRQGGHAQTGVVGEVPLAWADEGMVLGHEQVKSHRAAELAVHLDVVGVTSSPVVLAHRSDRSLRAVLDRVVDQRPLRSFTLADGLAVELWVVADADVPQLVDRIDGRRLYVTDGHHRIEAARRHRLGRQDVPGPHQHILGALFDEEQLRVEPFHRIVAPADAAVGGRLGEAGSLQECGGPPRPDRQGSFGVWLGGRWHRLDVDAGPDELSPSILQRTVLGPLFGIDDPTRDARLVTVAGTEPPEAVAARATALGGVAFLLHAVSVAQLMVAADQGRALPPKSTYFVPKMRSGIFLRPATSDDLTAAVGPRSVVT
jgi:uncharacterized protein (DUF1015 family)